MTFSFLRSSNPLSGQHLKVIWPRWEGNPKGLSGPLKGGVVLEYLAARFNFTYEMVKVKENRLEPPENGRGLFSYLWEQQCDLLVQDVLPTAQRIQLVDVTSSWNFAYFGFLIPSPDETANVNAIIKPFQWPVWLALAAAAISIIFVLYLMQSYFMGIANNNKASTSSLVNSPKEETKSRSLKSRKRPSDVVPVMADTGKLYLYVFGNLLSQGIDYCLLNRLPLRLVAGVWALATFILVQAYGSILFTYVITPSTPPIINSVYDIGDKSGVNLLVKKAGTLDTLFSNTNDTGLYRKLRDKLNSYPSSRCLIVSDCINQIKPGTKNVFVDSLPYQMDAIKAVFEKTGKCSIEIAKNVHLGIFIASSFALPKRSPFTKTVSQGLLELLEKGLVDYWDLWFRPMPRQCLNKIDNARYMKPTKGNHNPLSLNNMIGAFIILLAGLGIAFLVLLYENIISRFSKRGKPNV